MRLRFDQGTILIDEPTASVEALPLVKWDPRVGKHRAPAMAYAAIRAALDGATWGDQVLAPQPSRPYESSIPTLRPYQELALDAWEARARRGVIALLTGAGKSRIGAAAIAKTKLRTLVLVPTRVLMHQWARVLRELGIGPIGLWGDGSRELAPVTVATYEGALRAASRIGASFELLVIDEAHHFGHGARDEVLEMCVAEARLGLTATIDVESPAHARLIELMGPVVFELSTGDLAGRWLASLEHVVLRLRLTRAEKLAYDAEMRVFHTGFDPILRGRPGAGWPEIVAIAKATEAGRLALASLRAARRIISNSAAKQETLGHLLERHRHSRVLVFTDDNASAYEIARRHLVMPITCDIDRKERDRAIAAFREGALRTLVSARVLNEGLDVPEAEIAIIVGGALGAREHVQRVGRVLRPSPGKTAVVYELVVVGTSERRQAERRQAALGLGTGARS